jgi:photosystem II stability/assembly factor-like uncharacterized protein
MSHAAVQATKRPVPFLLVLLLCLVALGTAMVATPPAHAYISSSWGAWLWQNPVPQGNDVLSLAWCGTAGDTRVVAGCDHSLALETRDGGGHWYPMGLNTLEMTSSLALSGDGSTVWAASPSDLMISHNSGGSWSPVTPPSSSMSINTVACSPSGRCAWVTYNSPDELWATTDRGETWTKQSIGSTDPLGSVACTSDLNACAVEGDGSIFVTTDGGANWATRTTGGARLVDVTFADLTHGWAIGNAGAIWATTDGGQTWAAQTSTTSADLKDVSFADAQHGLAVGSDRVVSTTDGGTTWVERLAPRNPRRVAMPSATGSAWIVDEDGWLWSTPNLGATFISAMDFAQLNYEGLNAIDFSGAAHGVAVGQGAEIVKTADGGAHWQFVLYAADNVEMTSVAAASSGAWWIVRADGKIMHTADGGATIVKQKDPVSSMPVAIAATDTRHAWAACTDGEISTTTDGGTTWADHDAGVTADLVAISMADAQHGWAVGPGGTIVATANGLDWAPQTSGVTTDLTDVSFPTATIGYACGADGTVLATYDGGVTWTILTTDSSGDLDDIAFAGPLDGYVSIESTGTALVTHDGGLTWWPSMTGEFSDITDIVAVSATRAYLVSDGGCIQMTAGGGLWDMWSPTTKAYSATVRKGKKVTLRFVVSDPPPSSGYADATVVVTRKSGVVVKTIQRDQVLTNKTNTASFVCKLAPGTYRIEVTCVEPTGRRQGGVVRGTLKVTK